MATENGSSISGCSMQIHKQITLYLERTEERSAMHTARSTQEDACQLMLVGYCDEFASRGLKIHDYVLRVGGACVPFLSATSAISAAPTPLPSFAMPILILFSPFAPIWSISRSASRM